jgi:S1-C subfamily serine protease
VDTEKGGVIGIRIRDIAGRSQKVGGAILEEDVIVSVDGKAANTPERLLGIGKVLTPDQDVLLEVVRRGKRKGVRLVFAPPGARAVR